jgi:hypothetical protein
MTTTLTAERKIDLPPRTIVDNLGRPTLGTLPAYSRSRLFSQSRKLLLLYLFRGARNQNTNRRLVEGHDRTSFNFLAHLAHVTFLTLKE